MKRRDYPFTPEQESAAVFIAALIILCLVIIPLGMIL